MPIMITSTLDVTENRIINLGVPIGGNDAVTKAYVDAIATGLVWKDAVRAAATTDVDLVTPGAIDGVTLSDGDRVLLMGQTDPAENGIYTFTGPAGNLIRSSDADSEDELRPGSITTVSEGAGQGNKTYVLITDGPLTLGTTPLSFTLANNNTAPVYVAGDGIDIDAGSHAISALVATDGGLAASSSGLAAVAGDGITIDGSGISVDVGRGLAIGGFGLSVTASPGIVIDADGVGVMFGDGVEPDVTGGVSVKAGSGVTVDVNGVSVNASGGLGVDPESNSIVVAAGPGITAGGFGGVMVKAGPGIVVDFDDGVTLLVNPTGNLAVGAEGASVRVDPLGGIVPTTDGLAVKSANGAFVSDADGLWFRIDQGLTVTALGVKVVKDGNSIAVSGNGVKVNADPNGALVTTASGIGVKAGNGIIVDATGVSIDPAVVSGGGGGGSFAFVTVAKWGID